MSKFDRNKLLGLFDGTAQTSPQTQPPPPSKKSDKQTKADPDIKKKPPAQNLISRNLPKNPKPKVDSRTKQALKNSKKKVSKAATDRDEIQPPSSKENKRPAESAGDGPLSKKRKRKPRKPNTDRDEIKPPQISQENEGLAETSNERPLSKGRKRKPRQSKTDRDEIKPPSTSQENERPAETTTDDGPRSKRGKRRARKPNTDRDEIKPPQISQENEGLAETTDEGPLSKGRKRKPRQSKTDRDEIKPPSTSQENERPAETTTDDGPLSKRGKRRARKSKTGKDTQENTADSLTMNNEDVHDDNNESEQSGKSTTQKKGKKSAVVDKKSAMKERLEGARFRYLNEMLYTTHSKEAVKAFKQDPSSFDVYHQGYRRQIEKWPVKPINLAIQFVKSSIPTECTVVDMGCGEALLAASVPHDVSSFDLKALNDRVTVADMSKVPMQDGQAKCVVFCLSLMGTNLTDFIREAHRILQDRGILWIAEVASRFDGDIKPFCDAVECVGFKLLSHKIDLTHFVVLKFEKLSEEDKSKAKKKKKGHRNMEIALAPCLYKKR